MGEGGWEHVYSNAEVGRKSHQTPWLGTLDREIVIMLRNLTQLVSCLLSESVMRLAQLNCLHALQYLMGIRGI